MMCHFRCRGHEKMNGLGFLRTARFDTTAVLVVSLKSCLLIYFVISKTGGFHGL